MPFRYLVLCPLFLLLAYIAVNYFSPELLGPTRIDRFLEKQETMYLSWVVYNGLSYLIRIPFIAVIFSTGASLVYFLANSWIFHRVAETGEAQTIVKISYFTTKRIPFLPQCLQSPPQRELMCEFEKAKGNKFLRIREERMDQGFTLKCTTGFPIIRKFSTSVLGYITASPNQVISEAQTFRPGKNWDEQFFVHLKGRFVARDREDKILSSEINVHDHQVHRLVKLFERDKAITPNIEINTMKYLNNDFPSDVSRFFGNQHHFEEKRTVFLYFIEYEEDQPGKRWGVMLWLLSDQKKSAECYVIKTICSEESNNGSSVQGFTISHWNRIPDGYRRKYLIGMTESFSACTLIERYAKKHVAKQPSANSNYSLIDFSFDYFDNLCLIDPDLKHFPGEQEDFKRDANVTVHFYQQNLGASSSIPQFLKRIASLAGSPLRHWGIMFEFHGVNVPDRLRFITISGDKAHLSFERDFIVRFHYGRPDENTRDFSCGKKGTIERLSFKQILDYSFEQAGNFGINYNLFYVNCHEWARALYDSIAEKHHELPPLEYRLTACHLIWITIITTSILVAAAFKFLFTILE